MQAPPVIEAKPVVQQPDSEVAKGSVAPAAAAKSGAEPVMAPQAGAGGDAPAKPVAVEAAQPTTEAKPQAAPVADVKPAPVQPKDAEPVAAKPEPAKPTVAKPATTEQAAPSVHDATEAGERRTANGEQPDGRQAPAQQQEPQPQPAAVPAPKPVQPAADNAQPTEAQATAPATAPAAASRPASPAAATPVRLSHAPEAVENTIRIAQARGVTQARLALRPAELGGVEIHLRSTADGLVARVTADGREAAQVLQQAGDDLRRQLQSQGIDLQRLDIGVAGDPGHGPGAGAARERGAEGRDGSPHGSDEQSGADDGPVAAETHAGDTLELPDGVLVDVLA